MNEQVQELIDALNVIKNHCCERECFNCELADNLEDCLVTDNIPGEWDIDENPRKKILL